MRRIVAVSRRVLAVILVVAMLSSFLLYFRTDVTLNPKGMDNLGARFATQQLMSGESYAGSSRLQRMSSYALNLLSRLDNSADCDRAAQIAIAQANFVDAITFTGKAIELYEGDEKNLAALNIRMGYLYTLLGQYRDALKWLDKGLAVEEAPEARLTRAQVRLNLGDPQGALKDAETCMNNAEDPEQMFSSVVNIYEAAGEYKTAADYYSFLIDSTGEPDYLMNRAFCYSKLGKMREAANDCAAYTAAGGSEKAAADVMLGCGWMREGNYDIAGECFGRALEEGYPDPEALYYYIVLCAYVTGEDARACEFGDRMVDRIRSGSQAGSASIQMEDTTGRLNVSLVPLDESSLCMMTGASHMRMEQYNEAVECLSMCMERTPQNSFAVYLRGSCLLAMGRFDEAIVDFDAALAAGEEEEKCRFGRAVCRSQLGDVAGAMDDFDWVMLNGTDDGLFLESSKLMKDLMDSTSVS